MATPTTAPLQRPLPAPATDEPRRGWRTRASRYIPRAKTVETFAVFLVFFGLYFGIGYHVVVDLHLVNFDALSRLSHAYFVWYNDPPKLAAVGFVWPPVQTLIYLPFALIKPLATSLAALPAASATFMAATMVVLNRAFALAEMRWFARWPLLILFGVNPLILYYGANGMAEAVYLFFLTTAVYFLIRWNLTRRTHLLAMVGLAMAFAMLSRYEILPFAIVVGMGIVAITLAGRAREYRPQELEGSLLLFLAPVAYAGATWLFFNWLILGDPFNFLLIGPTTADVGTSGQDIAGLRARDLGLVDIVEYLVTFNIGLFPLSVIVVPVLIAVAIAKRNMLSLVLAALVCTNAAVTTLLFLQSHDPNLVQLRYNMRAIPLAMLGVAWIYLLWRSRFARVGIWLVTVAILILSLPFTWKTMETYTYQYEENLFLSALADGFDQEGNAAIGGYPIGIRDEEKIAEYIEQNVGEDEVIMTDDAQTLGIMLLSGHPEVFFDRIDRGDARWTETLNAPFGKVDYFLLTTSERCQAPCEDQIRVRYPGILHDRQPGMEVVARTRQYVLVKLDERPPPADDDDVDGASSAGAP